MNIPALDQLNGLHQPKNPAAPDAMRAAATQFEAILLMQLTSALNSTGKEGGEDEESLFGSDEGSGLAKQMFSEQLATTMAQSGGVGLSDIILRQLGGSKTKNAPGGEGFSGAIAAARNIKGNYAQEAYLFQDPGVSGKADPSALSKMSAGDPNDAQVISTFEDQVRAEGIDDSLQHLVLDGKIVNTTRARVVPSAAVRQIESSPVINVDGPSSTDSTPVRYQLPVTGRISSGFGNRFHPIDKRVKFHAGVDIAVPLGTTVGAAARGTVKFAGWDGDYGNLVIIEHPDGRVTRYGHLSKLLVATGDAVAAGGPIALSGSTGKSTGPHVHFEVRENGQVVNPIKILSNVLPPIADR
jgi:murein DD-endopeptidase MepM/ murein hydrolase activator NlpD